MFIFFGDPPEISKKWEDFGVGISSERRLNEGAYDIDLSSSNGQRSTPTLTGPEDPKKLRSPLV